MTNLLIALIVTILQGKSVEQLIREQALLVDNKSPRLKEILEEDIINNLYHDPFMIPFWFLLNMKEMPGTISVVLYNHKNHTRSKLVTNLITELRDRYRDLHSDDYHEMALATMHERSTDEERTYNHIDLLYRDFSDFYDMEHLRVKHALSQYHINKDKLCIAAQLFHGQD